MIKQINTKSHSRVTTEMKGKYISSIENYCNILLQGTIIKDNMKNGSI